MLLTLYFQPNVFLSLEPRMYLSQALLHILFVEACSFAHRHSKNMVWTRTRFLLASSRLSIYTSITLLLQVIIEIKRNMKETFMKLFYERNRNIVELNSPWEFNKGIKFMKRIIKVVTQNTWNIIFLWRQLRHGPGSGSSHPE